MIAKVYVSPFILNFDQRYIAGMVKVGIPIEEAWKYGVLTCLENLFYKIVL